MALVCVAIVSLFTFSVSLRYFFPDAFVPMNDIEDIGFRAYRECGMQCIQDLPPIAAVENRKIPMPFWL